MGGSLFCFTVFMGDPRTPKHLHFQNIPLAHFEISSFLLAQSEVLRPQSEPYPVTDMDRNTRLLPQGQDSQPNRMESFFSWSHRRGLSIVSGVTFQCTPPKNHMDSKMNHGYKINLGKIVKKITLSFQASALRVGRLLGGGSCTSSITDFQRSHYPG